MLYWAFRCCDLLEFLAKIDGCHKELKLLWLQEVGTLDQASDKLIQQESSVDHGALCFIVTHLFGWQWRYQDTQKFDC